MVILAFPPHEYADHYGLLAIGGDLEPASLLYAYRNGIFPWPSDDSLLTWFSPLQRGILHFENLHISRSLKKSIRTKEFQCAINHDFDSVIHCCAESANRIGQQGTWISPAMIRAYKQFHREGYAHSVECYLEGTLVGGVYGVAIGHFFAGESMFYRRTDASKVALLYLIQHLALQGVHYLDCQMVTELLASFGATEVSRRHYLRLLQAVIDLPVLDFSHQEPTAVNLKSFASLIAQVDGTT